MSRILLIYDIHLIMFPLLSQDGERSSNIRKRSNEKSHFKTKRKTQNPGEKPLKSQTCKSICLKASCSISVLSLGLAVLGFF